MTKARVIATAALLVAGVITGAWGLTASRGSAEPARAPSEAAPRPRPAAAEEPDQYEATRATLLGRPAPPLYIKALLQAPGDAPRTIEGLRGRAVVLEFWATWCGPCVEAFPRLNTLIDATRGDDVVFLSVTDEPTAHIAQFLAKNRLAARVGIDDKGESTRGYAIKSWPTTVLIDPSGVVREVMHPENLTAEIVRALAAGRPLPGADRTPARATASRPPRADLDRADMVVFLGPPDSEVGDDRNDPREIAGRQVTAEDLIRYCVREEAGGWYKSPRVLMECDLPARKFAFRVRVPEGSALSPFALLRQAAEAALGVRLRIDRESREQDVWLLVRDGTATPARPEGNVQLGRTIYGQKSLVGENSALQDIANWVEQSRPGLRVLDESGLEGRFDWRLTVKSFELEDLNATLKPIGLALRPGRRKVPYIVVRRADAAARP